MYQKVCTSVLWNRATVLDMGSDLYTAVERVTKRGTELRSIAADIATSMALLSDICITVGELRTLDPFTCEAEQYDVSLSLLGVCMCFNKMSVWRREMETHGDKVQTITELQVLLVCVQSAIKELRLFRATLE